MSDATVVQVDSAASDAIKRHGEASYPDEGAGFLLGHNENGVTRVVDALPVDNSWDPDEHSKDGATQRTRYWIAWRDWERAESEADERSLQLVGVFHSHPDHPPRPSQFDLNVAQPNFSYLITSVREGSAVETLAWRLQGQRHEVGEDDIEFVQEKLEVV